MDLQKIRGELDSKRMELLIGEKEYSVAELENRANKLKAEIAEMKKKLTPKREN